MTETQTTAAILGKEAFEAGKTSTPWHDQKLADLIKRNSTGVVGSSLPLLKAWIKAWNDANQSATAHLLK